MKIRHVTGALATVAVLAVPAAAIAQEEGFLKVTGGGQVVEMGQTGPGDTIAFNAQQTEAQESMMDSAQAKGQLQVVNRTAGRGADQVKFHGTVTCIRTVGEGEDEMIRFGGFGRTGEETGVPFTVDTRDNGEGSMADDDDMIAFRRRGANEEDPCDDSDTATELRDTRLARGNVQAHR